jgi:hypothetical protein
MRSLNDYASTRIEEPGRYFATVIECKNDYTRSGKECVFVRFETPENQTIVCSYVDSSYWKLYRLAVAAGLTEEERDRFFDEPELRFNPCFNGSMYKNGDNDPMCENFQEGFNPCFNGSMYKN